MTNSPSKLVIFSLKIKIFLNKSFQSRPILFFFKLRKKKSNKLKRKVELIKGLSYQYIY